MTLPAFQEEDLLTVSAALDVAEARTGDYYKFSLGQWKRHHYDIKTLSSLSHNQITWDAFALLNKGSRIISDLDWRTMKRDVYWICLQDHQILEALKRDKSLGLLPLLVYVFTHELVHIVRFCNFSQRFEISGKRKDREEEIVHGLTYEVLKDLSVPKLDYILDRYKDHRICDLAIA